MLQRVIIAIALLSVLLQANTITIAVAANVSYAMDELIVAFNKEHPNTNVRVILGSSGKLTAQIKNGAPYGLFIAANMQYPQALFDDTIAVTRPVVYAQGALALFSVQKHDLTLGLRLLYSADIKKIALANPKTAPYGKAAVEALTHEKVYEKVKSKFVLAESISQTVAYAITAADIGLIAKSSLYSKPMQAYKEHQDWESVDPSFYAPIEQGIVLLKHSRNSKEYRAFYDFMLSDKAKMILEKYGYIE